ncbi:hypothetical protein EVAR_92979_1 [Eumeta japonica]|uniref:Uncharacterized protein n=1 Tax=Eumeta variegata TaxID=151549 RepID=A0A4C1TAK7_EUMVA|nr:hypothetical protein EVAR_92979_1 [Eumeta japonica]
MRPEETEIENGAKVEIECGTKIRIESTILIGIGSSTETRFHTGTGIVTQSGASAIPRVELPPARAAATSAGGSRAELRALVHVHALASAIAVMTFDRTGTSYRPRIILTRQVVGGEPSAARRLRKLFWRRRHERARDTRVRLEVETRGASNSLVLTARPATGLDRSRVGPRRRERAVVLPRARCGRRRAFKCALRYRIIERYERASPHTHRRDFIVTLGEHAPDASSNIDFKLSGAAYGGHPDSGLGFE